MQTKKEEKMAKRKYVKPRLRAVKIAPGTQTLGIGCKVNPGTIGFYDNPCLNGTCNIEPGS
jgi:hypothetical protein